MASENESDFSADEILENIGDFDRTEVDDNNLRQINDRYRVLLIDLVKMMTRNSKDSLEPMCT